MTTIKVNDKVICPLGRRYRVIRLVSVFGIPAADLVRVRKDGTDAINRYRRGCKNLPVSGLEVIG